MATASIDVSSFDASFSVVTRNGDSILVGLTETAEGVNITLWVNGTNSGDLLSLSGDLLSDITPSSASYTDADGNVVALDIVENVKIGGDCYDWKIIFDDAGTSFTLTETGSLTIALTGVSITDFSEGAFAIAKVGQPGSRIAKNDNIGVIDPPPSGLTVAVDKEFNGGGPNSEWITLDDDFLKSTGNTFTITVTGIGEGNFSLTDALAGKALDYLEFTSVTATGLDADDVVELLDTDGDGRLDTLSADITGYTGVTQTYTVTYDFVASDQAAVGYLNLLTGESSDTFSYSNRELTGKNLFDSGLLETISATEKVYSGVFSNTVNVDVDSDGSIDATDTDTVRLAIAEFAADLENADGSTSSASLFFDSIGVSQGSTRFTYPRSTSTTTTSGYAVNESDLSNSGFLSAALELLFETDIDFALNAEDFTAALLAIINNLDYSFDNFNAGESSLTLGGNLGSANIGIDRGTFAPELVEVIELVDCNLSTTALLANQATSPAIILIDAQECPTVFLDGWLPDDSLNILAISIVNVQPGQDIFFETTQVQGVKDLIAGLPPIKVSDLEADLVFKTKQGTDAIDLHTLDTDNPVVVMADRSTDLIIGSAGHDRLLGDQGPSIIWGYDGNDVYVIGNGNNRLIVGNEAGAGTDLFAFVKGFGNNTELSVLGMTSGKLQFDKRAQMIDPTTGLLTSGTLVKDSSGDGLAFLANYFVGKKTPTVTFTTADQVFDLVGLP